VKGGAMKTTAQLYQQFLVSSQINYTCTYLSEHFEGLDENSIYRFLSGNKLTPRMVWEKARESLILSVNGHLLFDDSVLDKNFSFEIEGVKAQYSGNEHRPIKGIGLVSCVYYNPELDRYWIIDVRMYDPEADGKTKLDHMKDMLQMAIHRCVTFTTVLMDTWYATTEMMLHIDKDLGKLYYCPIKSNRQVDDSGDIRPYQAVSTLKWTPEEIEHGKLIKIKKFPSNYKHKLFRVVLSSEKTEWVVTNDLTQDSTSRAQEESAMRWKIEQFHREIKQLTGIERCQCRKRRSQRNHIICALRVWLFFNDLAYKTKRTMYDLKHNLLSDYMRDQLRSPKLIYV